MTTWANINLQDRASPIIEQLISFHDHTLIIILMIITVVAYIIGILILNKNINRFMLEGQIIEVAWRIAPAVILVFIAVPSLPLLYLIDETHRPRITLEVIGHQWYWRYEYSDSCSKHFRSPWRILLGKTTSQKQLGRIPFGYNRERGNPPYSNRLSFNFPNRGVLG
jgi:cytochrome c oxidase subunit 2